MAYIGALGRFFPVDFPSSTLPERPPSVPFCCSDHLPTSVPAQSPDDNERRLRRDFEMTGSNIAVGHEKRPSFNPHAIPFNPTAMPFQPAMPKPSIQPLFPTGGLYTEVAPLMPQPIGSTAPVGIAALKPDFHGTLFVGSGFPENDVLHGRSAPGQNFIVDAPVQGPANVEAIVPSSRKNQTVAQILEEHPLVQDSPKKIMHVSAPWSQAEHDMSKRDPVGWAALARHHMSSMTKQYFPKTVPKEMINAHYHKYSDVYTKHPQVVEVKENPHVPIQKFSSNSLGLANAHAEALKAYQNAAREEGTVGNVSSQPRSAPSIAAKKSTSAIFEEASTPTNQQGQHPVQDMAATQPFSPGPAFPALGEQPDVSKPSNPTMTPYTAQVCGYPQHLQHDPHPNGAPQHFGTPQLYTAPEYGYYYSGMDRYHTGTSLKDYVTQRKTRRNHRAGAKVKKSGPSRPKRTDQGPIPSEADIYPDDTDPAVEQGGFHPDKDSFDGDGLSGGVFDLPRMHDFHGLVDIPEETGNFSPHPHDQYPAVPGCLHSESAHMAHLGYLHNGQHPIHPVAHLAPPVPDRAPDGISDLQYRLTPITTTTPDHDDAPDTARSHVKHLNSSVKHRSGRMLTSEPDTNKMEDDQIDGSRYGLAYGGLGLHTLGDTWMPPAAKPMTRFSEMEYLWAGNKGEVKVP